MTNIIGYRRTYSALLWPYGGRLLRLFGAGRYFSLGFLVRSGDKKIFGQFERWKIF